MRNNNSAAQAQVQVSSCNHSNRNRSNHNRSNRNAAAADIIRRSTRLLEGERSDVPHGEVGAPASPSQNNSNIGDDIDDEDGNGNGGGDGVAPNRRAAANNSRNNNNNNAELSPEEKAKKEKLKFDKECKFYYMVNLISTIGLIMLCMIVLYG